MKKLLFGALALGALYFTACQKDLLNSSTDTITSLSATDRGGSGGNGTTGCGCLHGDTLTTADLPQAALDYVATNYPTLTILTVVGHTNNDGFSVELSDNTVLLFKADGSFVGICGAPVGPGHGHGLGDGHDGNCMSGDTLSVDSLPQAIVDYLATNYATATIQTVVSKKNGQVIAVELSDGTVLLFSAAGVFLHECGVVGTPGGPGHGPEPGGCMGGDTLTVAALPQAVTDYLTTNYPSLTIQTVVSKLNGQIFAVELSDGTVLLFKADGTFIHECGVGQGPGNGGGPGHGDGPGGGPGHGDGPGGPGNGGGMGHGHH